ncbi:GerMN domain-containing protein [Christensenellaceae bacterium OttesenSCG-928-K19]|nr:GerMN domain-containing protein [Christensenellaceae bacterium OttesenSCG-928-K19]
MKKTAKIVLVVIIIAVVVILLAVVLGSQAKNRQEIAQTEAAENISATPTPTVVPAPTPTPVPTSPLDADAQTPVSFGNNVIEYEYFDVVENETKTIKKEVGEQTLLIQPFKIIAEQFFEKPLDETPIEPNSVELRDDSIYIDLKKSIYTSNLGSSGESAVLESIANSYLNNMEGVESVYISVDGGPYESSHIEFSQYEPYKAKE